MCNTGYKSCVNRYIKQNSIYITCVILDISHVSIDILSRIASTFIYADDITLLAPSRASMVLMLEKCESFALTHDILFNASKTKDMIFKRCESVNTAPLYFKNMPINCVHECDLLGITLSSSRTTANVIEKAVMKCNMKSNEIITDFKLLPCYIKANLFTTFCTDAIRMSAMEF